MNPILKDQEGIVPTEDVVGFFGRSSRTVQRMIAAKPPWLVPSCGGGKGSRNGYDVDHLRAAKARLNRGERPPLLPCELRAQERRAKAPANARIDINVNEPKRHTGYAE